jgi:L-ascorbate metabolism protein UlaG (beta-lactamase superfamily)
MNYQYKNLLFSKYDHDTVTIQTEAKDKSFVFDPFQTQGSFKADFRADYVFISHDHFDHFSPKDIHGVASNKSKYVFPTSILDKVQTFLDVKPENTIPVVPLEEYQLPIGDSSVTCMAVPAYNLNKRSPQGNIYHTKESAFVGFLLVIDSVSVYFTGDTDPIPEMEALAGMVEVLLLPISGVYVMNLEEAVETTLKLQPSVVIPMHYGTVIGDISLGEQFRQQLEQVAPNITVVV